MTNAELLKACRCGNRVAWDIFFRKFGAQIYGVALKVLRKHGASEDLANEIVQEVTLDFGLRQRFRKLTQPESLRRYLIAYTVCRTLDMIRKSKRESEKQTQLEAPYAVQSPLAEAQAQELKTALTHELSYLSNREIFILRMSSQEGLTFRQIGSLLNDSPDTIASTLRRLRERLKHTLERKGYV